MQRPYRVGEGERLPRRLSTHLLSCLPLAASGIVPPVRIESSSSSLAEGQTLELNCLVAGQAQPKVTWFKRGGALPANHQVRRCTQTTSPGQGFSGQCPFALLESPDVYWWFGSSGYRMVGWGLQ